MCVGQFARFRTTAICPRCYYSSREMRLSEEQPHMMGCNCCRCTISSTWRVRTLDPTRLISDTSMFKDEITQFFDCDTLSHFCCNVDSTWGYDPAMTSGAYIGCIVEGTGSRPCQISAHLCPSLHLPIHQNDSVECIKFESTCNREQP